MKYGPSWEEELNLLLEALPLRIALAVKTASQHHDDLLEVVMDLGREPEARFRDGEVILEHHPISKEDIDAVVANIGMFGDDNRAGIARTLHRISAIRNRTGEVIGLTCRVGRAVTGTIDIIRDIVMSGESLLLLGEPGIGKTTMLRECARVLSEECGRRVVIIDTSNEIAGDGDIPHPGIGRARRMQVRTPSKQHAVMIEAVENHMPQVIIIDEIGTELEASAARTIAERGVQLVATAHGSNLDNLLVNPTLNDLLGGIQSVTLSDEEARRRGTQKSVLERKAPPTFDVLVEIQSRDRVTIHRSLTETVDSYLRGSMKAPQIRSHDPLTGQCTTENGSLNQPRAEEEEPSTVTLMGLRSALQEKKKKKDRPAEASMFPGQRSAAQTPAPVTEAVPIVSVFPYGVSRSYLEQSIKELQLPIRIQHSVERADVLLTLKPYFRRKDSPIKYAESAGLPIQVLRSNTVTQIKHAIARLYSLEVPELEERALLEAQEAIERAQREHVDVDLAPQNGYIRKLQHQFVEQNLFNAKSAGSEPNRHVVVMHPREKAS